MLGERIFMKKTVLCIAACLSLLSLTACNQKIAGDGSAYSDGHGTGEMSGSVGQDIQRGIDQTTDSEQKITDRYYNNYYGTGGITGNGSGLTAETAEKNADKLLVDEMERRNYP